ncbi:MAG: hypothetical protein L6R40_005152 [Gallowayella cf. fulva]|nr:MAG: hypothetical protein L6R40_005152 [Xanthomendoza cf. fulva]
MHLLSLLPLILFPLTVSAGWVRMWTTSAQVGRKHPVHFTQPSWQDNICFGPIGGSPPFHIEAINFRPGTMAMFTDECREQNLIDCDDCTGLVVNWNTSVVHHGRGEFDG